MGMCRFEDENDDGYDKFKGVLAKFVVEIESKQQNEKKTALKADVTRRDGQSSSGIWSNPPVTG